MEEKLTAKEIIEYRTRDSPNIPVMGCKHFQQNGTIEEISQIQSHLAAVKGLLSYQNIQKLASLSQSKWHPDLQKAEVISQVGSCWSVMGHTINKKLYLFPEEALYLLEMGALEIIYNDTVLSTQRAYCVLLYPQTDVTLECYRVYSHLSSSGYKVLRHIHSNILTKYEKQLEMHKAGVKVRHCSTISKKHKCTDAIESENNEQKKPKMSRLTETFPVNVTLGNEYLEKLRIFEPFQDNSESTLKVDYDIYLPEEQNKSFKKTCIQLPNFRIVVHRGSDPMPEMRAIYRLIRQFEDAVPVINAVVFPEFISFYHISPVTTPVCD